jgi:hypothetical protein
MQGLVVAVVLVAIGCVTSTYVPVPGGFLMHETCVHQVESGATVENRAGQFVVNGRELPHCIHPIKRSFSANHTANGWQAWTSFQQPNNETFVTFNGYFSVPEAPVAWGNSARSGIVYIVSLKVFIISKFYSS